MKNRFYDIKGDIEAVFEQTGLAAEFVFEVKKNEVDVLYDLIGILMKRRVMDRCMCVMCVGELNMDDIRIDNMNADKYLNKIHEIIYSELSKGILTNASKQIYLQIIENLKLFMVFRKIVLLVCLRNLHQIL